MTPFELLIQAIENKRNPIISLGKIKSVDSDKCSCVIEFEDGERADFQDCRLNSIIDSYDNFLFITPKIGSYVLVAQIEKSTTDVFVIAYSEIDSVNIKIGETSADITKDGIVFNGGNFDGMVKIKELEDNLNALKNYIQAINAALPAAFTAIGASTAALGENGATSYQAAMAGKIINLKNMEDAKIKH